MNFRYVFYLFIFFTIQISAISLKETVTTTLSNNPYIQAELIQQKGYKKYVDDAESNYLPTIDLESYYERIKQNLDRKSSSTDGKWTKQTGYNAAIIFRQYLFDGGITPSKVRKAKHDELANKYRSLNEIEKTVLDTVKVYNELVKSDERIKVTKNMVKTNEQNMITAKENENISGEVLETYQVASKLHFVADRYIDEEDKKDTAIINFTRFVGVKPKGKTCRQVLDEEKIPKTIEEAVRIGILNNYKILEQIEKIKVQREKIAQARGEFLPKLNLELKVSVDKNINLIGDGKTKDIYGKLNFNWNLFNGNKDKIATEQERIFLNQEKKTLDDITNEIVSTIKILFRKNQKYKARIIELEKYIQANTNIVAVYKDQFLAGTRTFIDILNAESELYESIKALIDLEYISINNYYELMFNFSSLSETIMSSKEQNCEEVKPRIIEFNVTKQNKELGLDDLISDTDSSIIKSFESSEKKKKNLTYNKSIETALTNLKSKNIE